MVKGAYIGDKYTSATVVHDMVILTDIDSMRVWRYHYSTMTIFIELLLIHVPALSMAMSDKPVSIEPANAGKDETEPKIELVVCYRAKRSSYPQADHSPQADRRCSYPFGDPLMRW